MGRERTAAPAEVVQLTGVEKIFDNGVTALSGFDLTVRAGEFVALLGASGCGKSTVLRLISDLDPPTAGQVRVLGTDAKAARRSGRLAYVFQDATLLPWASVADNVALPLKLAGRARTEIDAAVSRTLDIVGLSDRHKDLPRQLSGGMRMRVSIARALTLQPALLLMDEPFAALDEITRQDLQNEIKQIWSRTPDLSIVFVTHNIFEAASLATRIAVLRSRPGRVAADIANPIGARSADQAREHPDFGATVNRIADLLRRHGGVNAA